MRKFKFRTIDTVYCDEPPSLAPGEEIISVDRGYVTVVKIESFSSRISTKSTSERARRRVYSGRKGKVQG